MKALVTGASSGIGRDMAKYLSKLGYHLILVARNEEKLKQVQKELETPSTIYLCDMSKEEQVKLLYKTIKEKEKNIDLVINNAGFGLFGEFTKTDLDTEINMIQTNVIGVQILTKLFMQDMVEKDKGTILNVASIAGFMPGPLMATYYATKSYIVRLTQGLQEELHKKKSKVQISLLCPGPVNTNFNNVADVKFNLKGLSSEYVAKYAIDKTLKGKKIIVPGSMVKLAKIGAKICPDSIVAKISYKMQKRKQ